MKQPPRAYAVHFMRLGQSATFITLERSRADEYAVEKHGVIKPLYYEEDFVPQSFNRYATIMQGTEASYGPPKYNEIVSDESPDN